VAKQQRSAGIVSVVLETLGGPMLVGLAATVAFYLVLHQGMIRSQLLVRYCAAHPVEYAEVLLFFVGLAAVLRCGQQALAQLVESRSIGLQSTPAKTVAQLAAALLAQMRALPAKVRHTIYARRLTAALEHLERHDSAAQLDDELKYLADMDAERNHERYALVRIVIWATPMLGFLGTVIGITMALGDLSPESLVNSPKEAMDGLLAGLSVAFDTTALALTLSIILMFAQFVSLQLESQLLAHVDRRVVDQLAAYFRPSRESSDPQLAVVQRMSQAIVAAIETHSQRQSELWHHALQTAHQQWTSTLAETGQMLRQVVAKTLEGGLEDHRSNLLQIEQAASQAANANWQQWHAQSAETLSALRQQQIQLVRQGEILTQALQAAGEVMNLEKALNQNLRALAGAKNFEDTVMSLSAAIHLLSSRLSRPFPRDAQVRLEASSEERAA
jgi:biopolymer transport protein ExbB/TolQ